MKKDKSVDWSDIEKKVGELKDNKNIIPPKKNILKKLVAVAGLLVALGVWKLVELIAELVIYIIK